MHDLPGSWLTIYELTNLTVAGEKPREQVRSTLTAANDEDQCCAAGARPAGETRSRLLGRLHRLLRVGAR